ncbi:XVIPCD domain-containing protein [Lysobacter tyrosinilyticus]
MTNETTPAAAPATLSDAELRALAYFAVGVSSEGSVGGRNVAYHLSFAGNIRQGVMTPVGNSGYSIGTLQTDLGQHPEVATELVTAYQTWANREHPDWALTPAQVTQTTSDLSRNGHTITAQHGRDLDTGIKSHLNRFLASDAGITFVHDRDVAQVGRLVRAGGAVDQLQQTTLYRNASTDDQARLATIFMKLENQSGNGYYPRILGNIQNGRVNSVDDVRDAVAAILPNRNNRVDYVESGSTHALHGAEVFIALRNTDPRNPMRQNWQDVVADPLINPTTTANVAARPNLSSQYPVVKDLFMHADNAPAFVHALDRGGTYGYDVIDARGRHHAQSKALYAAGDDFVVMDGNGIGKSYIGGVWSDVNRTDLVRATHHDGTVDLNMRRNGAIERLLHVDPNAALLRPARTATTDAPAPVVPEAARPAAPTPAAPPAHAPDARALPLNGRDASLLDAIQRQLPAGTSIDQAAHVMARAQESGIRDVAQLDKVAVMDGQAWVVGKTPGYWAKVDLSAPVPPLQESLRAVDAIAQREPMAPREQPQRVLT